MAYIERLRIGRYRSPSGAEFEFQFRDLSRSGDKKAAIHELPEQDAAPVQDLGNAALRFPIEAIFTGADYDLTADAFFDALGERGPGLLLHPRWGDIPVLPVSRSQSESFVDGMRRAVFTIDFVRVPDVEYIVSSVQLEGQISADAEAASVAATTDIGSAIVSTDAAGAERVKGGFRATLDTFKANVADMIATSQDLQDEFDDRVRKFEADLNTLILDPLVLSQEWLAIARLPAQAVTSIKAKIDGYRATIETIGDIALATGAQTAEAASRVLQLFGFVVGESESVTRGDIADRVEAAALAEEMRGAWTVMAQTVEADEAVTGYNAPQSSLANARAINSAASDLLFERSFSLRIQQRVTLSKDYTPLDLAFELYGDLEKVDELIEQNGIGDDEIFLIPRGREVVYYGE